MEKDIRKAHLEAMEALGINIKNKTYEEAVDVVILELICAMEQIEMSNKDWLKQQLKHTISN